MLYVYFQEDFNMFGIRRYLFVYIEMLFEFKYLVVSMAYRVKYCTFIFIYFREKNDLKKFNSIL